MDEMNKAADQGSDSTEQKIFEAAREEFIQKGLDGAKMQDIADRAGINKALLHYYYRSKEKLYIMVAKAVIGRAIPAIQQNIESDAPLELKIRRFIEFYIDVVSVNHFVPLFLLSEMNKHPERFQEHILPVELPKPAKFFRQVEEEIAKGTIRPINPQHLLVNMISMCVFPFIARPMIRLILGMDAAESKTFFAERKKEITEAVLASIAPQHTTPN